MDLDFIIETFHENSDQLAIVWNEQQFTYLDLIDKLEVSNDFLNQNQVQSGDVIALIGDYTPNTITLMISLFRRNCIVVPLLSLETTEDHGKIEITQVQKIIRVDIDTDIYTIKTKNIKPEHIYYKKIRMDSKPGLVLFSSGTSGQPKAAVHDFSRLLNKFKIGRKSYRTINFLLFDHWGGLNTLFYTLSNAGVVIAPKDRTPKSVCRLIENYSIELLPVSPSFLNLLLLSNAYKDNDLSSLKLITYGAEPMPMYTLKRAKSVFTDVRFQQTYGLIELGVLRSKSESDDSLLVKLGGEGFDLRVVDNMLQIKSDSAMLGYLNAASPFTDDGYFMTGDEVEVHGDYFRILGRRSEIINVGGEKVYPQEVENVILTMENVKEVTVYGEKNALLGAIVCAKVSLKQSEDLGLFKIRLKKFCKDRLQKFKIPVKISVTENPLYNDRFKKSRNSIP